MPRIGTPLSPSATRVLLCGCGELGKELVIELQRLGVEVIAVDRYANAPAMQVAHRSHVIDMLDGAALRSVIEQDTSPYRFADSLDECRIAARALGFPCLIKPVMSSSGKGQSVLRSEADIDAAWDYAQAGGRAGRGRVIVEGFIDFDYEITLLTVRHAGGTSFCEPVGHRQEKGDYQESWQPQPMEAVAMAEARRIALAVTDALGGRGIFGVELFVKGDQVWFCEISPRPHDTGLVTLVSQELSEFALHARAILGLPIPVIRQLGPAASAVILVEGESAEVSFGNLADVLAEPDTALRLFGKPGVSGQRRMGVALARDVSIDAARQKALRAAAAVKVEV